MVESQSRYGIMEEINEKKLKAQAELANMEKEKVVKEMQCKDETMKIQNQIDITKSSFEAVHKNSVLYEKMEMKLLKQEMEDRIRQSETKIEEWNNTYENNAKESITSLENRSKEVKKNFDKYNQLKDMEIASKKLEINELDNAIQSLKEISQGDKD